LETDSHLLSVDFLLLQLNINNSQVYEARSGSDALDLLCKGIAGELMDDVGDRLGMVENFDQVISVADGKEKKSVDDEVRKRLVIDSLPVVLMAQQGREVDSTRRMLQVYLQHD
jgi:hypothetical protein